MKTVILPIVFMFAGLFIAFCAAMNFDWFMESTKARFFAKLFGRNGARVFYIVLGVIFIIAAIIAWIMFRK